MARPYPRALREAVAAALEAGVSPMVIAGRYGIAPRTVRRYQWRLGQYGHLRPTPHPGRPRLIPDRDAAALAVQVRQHATATLATHCRIWEAQTGVRVSVATMSRTIRRLGWTRQRRPPQRMP